MQINEKIKKAREKANMTQKELAEKMNTTQQQIWKYEKGKQDITAARLKDLCKICKVSADWILETGEYSLEN